MISMGTNDRRINKLLDDLAQKSRNPFNYFINQVPRIRGGQKKFSHTVAKNKKNGR